ncbi:lipid A deacylase LpxR family protein [Kiloniella sp. b19]|uniref:lipid A deacylase LpxR family protein n=1 Tax=Kiloniella sp. GXU_MW_B19 TaxID=3141326 RepID=UPI0031D4A447
MNKALLAGISSALIAAFPPALAKDTLQDRIPEAITSEDNSFLTITVENDLFGSGTDENYTSGVRLTYFNDKASPPEFVRSIGDAVPFFNINETTSIYYSAGQNLYTPEVITTRIPDPNDRPYAGFLYGSIGYRTLFDNHVDDIELTLGVVGPAALGEETQRFVHDLIGSDDPKGWDSQLENEPVVMLAYQRIWPDLFSAPLDPFYFRIAPHAGATLGNAYTYANAGLTFLLVPERHRWQTAPARVRPAIPGSGQFYVPEDEFSWLIFAGVEGRAVARNIFLDGNSFEDSPSVDKKYGVLDVNTGFTVTYGRTQIAYTLNWRSDEFDNQRDNSLFGSVSLGYRF